MGSILIAPLIKRFPTRSVLAVAVMVFGLLTAVLMIVDASTGGKIKRSDEKKPHYGHWNANGLFPVYCVSNLYYLIAYAINLTNVRCRHLVLRTVWLS